MKHSLRFKITLVLVILISFTIFLTWFINRTFLADFYLHSKMETLDMVYDQVRNTYQNSEGDVFLTDDETTRMERLSSNYDVNIYVLMNFAGRLASNYPAPINIGEREKLQINMLLSEYLYSGSNPEIKDKKLLKGTDNYFIFSLYDTRLDSQYIDLVGGIEGNKVIFLRSNFESIQESVAIANQFLAYIGFLAVIIGTIVMLIISKKITQPILDLAGIAKKMSDLDFDIKYQVNSQDEIGELGNSINALSDKLETTITELKGANNELQNDIQKKTEVDEMRKEFLSNVSHELKTPLSLIQGYAEGLKENVNEDEENRNFYCDVIIDEAIKMNRMVKKLLTLNELEFGNNQVSIERFDIVTLIRSVLDENAILLKQKEVMVIFEEKNPVYVWADEYLIEQVVTNYISNALNHADGAKVIEIKLICMKDVIRVAVFNTGDSIPEEELDKIWIKFYKIDKARTREYGGNGIGLSIVKAIMNSHNHECGVINRPSGVEFWFELDSKS